METQEFTKGLIRVVDNMHSVPVVFILDEKLLATGVDLPAQDELILLVTTNESKTHVFYARNYNADEYQTFDADFIAHCVSYAIHPAFLTYKQRFNFEAPLFTAEDEFDQAIQEIIRESDEIRRLELTFCQPVYIPMLDNFQAVEKAEVIAVVYTLRSGRKNAYLLPEVNSKRFFNLRVIPFQAITGVRGLRTGILQILIKKNAVKAASRTSSPNSKSSSQKVIYQITEGGNSKGGSLAQKEHENKDYLEIPLVDYLSDNQYRVVRDDRHCIICARAIKNKEETVFVHYLQNGNLTNTVREFDETLEGGFYPIGPDCKTKLPDGFVFTWKAIREHQMSKSLQEHFGIHLEGVIPDDDVLTLGFN